MARTFRGVPENRNFLYPTGFHLSIRRAPTVGYYGQQVNIPDLNLGIVEQPSYTKSIPIPGEIIDFGDLTLNFMVDEDLGNYMEIQNWIRGLGFPETLKESYDLQKSGSIKSNFENSEEDNKLCFKIDDIDFNKTNKGVWTMSMEDFKSKSGFTKWNEYKQDEPIEEKNIWQVPMKTQTM